MEEFIIKVIRFGVVGVSGTAIDFGLTWFCKEILKLNKFLANSIGFVIAATSNYYLNRVWTFESTNSNIAGEYISFLVVSVIGLLINNLIIYLCNNKWQIRFYWAKVLATGVVMFWNFFANYLFTFA